MQPRHERQDHVLGRRIFTLVLMDLLAINISALAALLVRFEFDISALAESGFVQVYLETAPVYSLGSIGLFALFHLYRSLWRYASIDELRYIILSAVSAALFEFALCRLLNAYLPLSMPILNLLFLFLSLTLIRYSYRIARRLFKRHEGAMRRTMLIGAGAAGAMVVRELKRSPHSQNEIVCIVDDDPAKKNSLLSGVPVVGGRDCIPDAVEKFRVTDIIFAIPTASRADTRRVIEICQSTGCRLQILPGIYQLASGQIRVKQIRDVQVEDLLGLDKVQPNLS